MPSNHFLNKYLQNESRTLLNIEDTRGILENNVLGRSRPLVFYLINLMYYCPYNALGILITIRDSLLRGQSLSKFQEEDRLRGFYNTFNRQNLTQTFKMTEYR